MTTSRQNNFTNNSSAELDLRAINDQLSLLSARERINWATKTFGKGLYALTSAGVDSALMLDHISHADQKIPVIHINTGFLPKETLDFRNKLKAYYGLKLYEFGPSKSQVAELHKSKLWKSDLESYSKITKLKPMSKAIKKLGVKALLVGVRSDQTNNRATLDFVGKGSDGEIRIHPFLDWPLDKVASYIATNKLPRNSLYDKGFGSVGDLQTTAPGIGRTGREVMECGINIVGGKVVRQNI